MLERLESFASRDAVRTHVEREVSLDGSLRWYQWTDRAFAEPATGKIVEFQSVGHDVTDQRRAAEFTVHQAEILEQVARGVPLEEILVTIAAALEGQFPRFSCAIMLLDADDATLRVGGRADPRAAACSSRSTAPRCRPPRSCGAAAVFREPVYVCDVATTTAGPGPRRRARARIPRVVVDADCRQRRRRACSARSTCSSAEPRLPEDEHRQIFVLLAQLASIAIERKAFEDRLAHQALHDPLTGLPNRAAVPRPARPGARALPAHGRRVGVAVPRPRPLQGRQRQPRSRRRATSCSSQSRARSRRCPPRRHGRPLRRRRVHGALRGPAVDDGARRGGRDRRALLATVIQPDASCAAPRCSSARASASRSATSGDERPETLLRDADAAMYHAKERAAGASRCSTTRCAPAR